MWCGSNCYLHFTLEEPVSVRAAQHCIHGSRETVHLFAAVSLPRAYRRGQGMCEWERIVVGEGRVSRPLRKEPRCLPPHSRRCSVCWWGPQRRQNPSGGSGSRRSPDASWNQSGLEGFLQNLWLWRWEPRHRSLRILLLWVLHPRLGNCWKLLKTLNVFLFCFVLFCTQYTWMDWTNTQCFHTHFYQVEQFSPT